MCHKLSEREQQHHHSQPSKVDTLGRASNWTYGTDSTLHRAGLEPELSYFLADRFREKKGLDDNLVLDGAAALQLPEHELGPET